MKNSIKLLSEKTKEELETWLLNNRNELARLVLDKNSGKLKNMRSIFNKRKERARILTVLRQKEQSFYE